MITNLILLGVLGRFFAGVWAVIKWILVVAGAALIGGGIANGIFSTSNDDDQRIGGIVMLCVGFVLCLFFAIIPYWPVCKWILLVASTSLAIVCFCIRGKKVAAYISSGVAGVVFIIMVFIPYWDTVRWILLGIGGLAVCAGVCVGLYFLIRPGIRKIAENRYAELTRKFKSTTSQLGLPTPNDLVFDRKSKRYAKQTIRRISKLKDALEKAPANSPQMWKIKQKLNKAKMDAFYLLSLRCEAQNDLSVYEPFEKLHTQAVALKNYNILRHDKEENAILSYRPTNSMMSVENWKRELADDKTINYSREMNRIQRMDTSGIFGLSSTSKLSQQTHGYANLVNAAVAEANELQKANLALNKELTTIRLCAYRNIYLGIELLNYLRDGAGGERLTTEKSFASLGNIPLDTVNINIKQLNMSIDNICDTAVRGFDTAMNSLRALGLNPGRKTSIAVGGIAAIGALASAYNQAESANRAEQARLISTLNQIIDTIQTGQAGLKRTIEIMEAIIKTNNGFMQIYAPFRDKVFVSHQPCTEQDVLQLSMALQEYQKISTSRI